MYCIFKLSKWSFGEILANQSKCCNQYLCPKSEVFVYLFFDETLKTVWSKILTFLVVNKGSPTLFSGIYIFNMFSDINQLSSKKKNLVRLLMHDPPLLSNIYFSVI